MPLLIASENNIRKVSEFDSSVLMCAHSMLVSMLTNVYKYGQ